MKTHIARAAFLAGVLFSAALGMADSKITVNGITYTCPDGANIEVKDNSVTCKSTSTTAVVSTGSQITGRSCKEHMAPAVMSSTQAASLQSYYTSPREVQLANFQFKEGMNNVAKAYITGVKQILSECEQFCTGLVSTAGEPFNCKGLGLATTNQVHIAIRDNAILLDSATSSLPSAVAQEIPAETFEPITDAQAGEDAAVANDARAEALRNQPAYKNYYIKTVNEPRESLIEL